MIESWTIQGSRFYMPRNYQGSADLYFTSVSGDDIYCRACEVSCFSLVAIPGTLKIFTVVHLFTADYIVTDSKDEVLEQLGVANANVS